MREALGVSSNGQLAKVLGYTAQNVSLWRKRGAVPEAALARVKALEGSIVQQRLLQRQRQEMGTAVLYEGLCLAIWLAPSLDAFGRRFGAANFTGTLRQYASLFTEIEVACAEEIEAKLREIGGANATLAFEELTKEPAEPLMERIIQRAHHWRFGDAET